MKRQKMSAGQLCAVAASSVGTAIAKSAGTMTFFRPMHSASMPMTGAMMATDSVTAPTVNTDLHLGRVKEVLKKRQQRLRAIDVQKTCRHPRSSRPRRQTRTAFPPAPPELRHEFMNRQHRRDKRAGRKSKLARGKRNALVWHRRHYRRA